MNKTDLGKKNHQIRLCSLDYLAIDDIAYKKEYRYKSIGFDLKGRRAADFGESPSSDALVSLVH